jgi:hypothetical protein
VLKRRPIIWVHFWPAPTRIFPPQEGRAWEWGWDCIPFQLKQATILLTHDHSSLGTDGSENVALQESHVRSNGLTYKRHKTAHALYACMHLIYNISRHGLPCRPRWRYKKCEYSNEVHLLRYLTPLAKTFRRQTKRSFEGKSSAKAKAKTRRRERQTPFEGKGKDFPKGKAKIFRRQSQGILKAKAFRKQRSFEVKGLSKGNAKAVRRQSRDL